MNDYRYLGRDGWIHTKAETAEGALKNIAAQTIRPAAISHLEVFQEHAGQYNGFAHHPSSQLVVEPDYDAWLDLFTVAKDLCDTTPKTTNDPTATGQLINGLRLAIKRIETAQ